jgi:hypothetical protein
MAMRHRPARTDIIMELRSERPGVMIMRDVRRRPDRQIRFARQ